MCANSNSLEKRPGISSVWPVCSWLPHTGARAHIQPNTGRHREIVVESTYRLCLSSRRSRYVRIRPENLSNTDRQIEIEAHFSSCAVANWNPQHQQKCASKPKNRCWILTQNNMVLARATRPFYPLAIACVQCSHQSCHSATGVSVIHCQSHKA